MAISRAKKEEIVAKVSKVAKGSPSLVFVNFHKLSVTDTTKLRKLLRESGSGYLVAKKTLITRALKDGSLSGGMPELNGEIALAYGNDPIAPARTVAQFRKGHEEHISIAGGVFENRFMDAVAMNAIANIPSREVLYGMFVNVVSSPMRGLVIALNQLAEKSAN